MVPVPSSTFDSQSAVRRRNLFRCVLRPYKVEECGAIIISCCSLQCVTDRRSRALKARSPVTQPANSAAKRQMNVNAREDQMIGNAINDATFAAFPVSQPRKLTVRVIERIRADMQHHARDVDARSR